MQVFNDVEYSGTLFINTVSDDDIVGIVFGYQSRKKFFVASWKQEEQVYWDKKPFRATAVATFNIKVTLGQLLRSRRVVMGPRSMDLVSAGVIVYFLRLLT